MKPRFPSPGFLAASALAAAPASAQPSFQGLGFLPAYERSAAHAVSADGSFVVGNCINEETNTTRAFRWSSSDGMRDLGELQGGMDFSDALTVSAHGFHVAGVSQAGNGVEGFRWQAGVMTGIGDLAGGDFYSGAAGVAADGFVISAFSQSDTALFACRAIGGGPLISIGDLPGGETSSVAYGCSADGAVLVGQGSSAEGREAFRWTGATGMVGLGDLPGGGINALGRAVSADGSVVVGFGEADLQTEAFRWTAATGMVSLGSLPGGKGSEATGASADGSVVVGEASDANNDPLAFIWDAQHGMRSVRDVLIGLGVQGLAGWQLPRATGVSPDGLTIVGFGVNPDGLVEGWIAHLGQAFTRSTERVSVSATEQQGDGGSTLGSVSASGQIVCFWSNATNLVAGDTNGKSDVFVRNRSAQFTTRVSIATGANGAQGNGDSLNGQVSANGNFVVFSSDATNLVAGDTNGKRDIFIRDRVAGTIARVSVSTAGAQANGASDLARVSADGRFVVFQSDATNLVASDTNGKTDIFIRDRQTGTTTRASLTSAGAQANGRSYQPGVSDNGLSVVFASDANNLVAGDTNLAPDVFVRNRQTGQTALASPADGKATPGNLASFGPVISANGRYIAFTSSASNLHPGDTNNANDVFVRDRFNATTTRVSMAPNQANGDSAAAAISANGRYVLYSSEASNLVKNDTNGIRDAFVHDNWTFLTERVSLGQAGQQAVSACAGSGLSADGRFVLFNSLAANLVGGDTNGKSDVFLRDTKKPQ
jgi:probable HAF family extracellular repeat protein